MANKKSLALTLVIGPTEPVPGFAPPNPADSLRSGPLGTRSFSDSTQRLPFRYPTKSALHRNAGPSNEEINQPYLPCGVGEDQNKYSQGPNDPETLEGEPIRGT